MLVHTVFPQYYNALIQMSRRWNKYPTLYFSFPLGNQGFNIKEVTRDIVENIMITFTLLQMFCFLKQRSKIQDPFYVIFSTIMGCYLLTFLLINEG